MSCVSWVRLRFEGGSAKEVEQGIVIKLVAEFSLRPLDKASNEITLPSRGTLLWHSTRFRVSKASIALEVSSGSGVTRVIASEENLGKWTRLATPIALRGSVKITIYNGLNEPISGSVELGIYTAIRI